MSENTVPAGTRIGHVHLKVADLGRSVHFYCDIMGFEKVCDLGTAVFIYRRAALLTSPSRATDSVRRRR
jgi:catechol-2,3-dioxygenase